MAAAEYQPPAPEVHTPGEVDDLGTLDQLDEDLLLKELRVRYEKDIIYTYVNDILVAVNPFKQLPLYTPEVSAMYNQTPRAEAPPHAYAVADACYHNLFKMKQNQCAVISGESGAGKTESAKFIINQIIELCRAGSYGTNLEEQIIKISPLLEAFGNATTVMNHNSSRFGKYTRLLFDAKGAVMGVQLSEYLLEKARVVSQTPGERNFHVFYYLMCHAQKDRFLLTEVEDFRALGGHPSPGSNEMLAELTESMRVVGFTEDQENDLFSVLAAVLHLCNISFEAEGEEAFAVLSDRAPVDKAAQLLAVDADALAKVLVGTETITRGERIERRYTKPQAEDVRDALAKALYSSMFGWIVNGINELLAPELHQKRIAGGRPGKTQAFKVAHEIGVLDIFGFEHFENNSFEQLCINVAHEQLQYFFNRHNFSLELEEYDAEGVDVSKISFRDNYPLVKMCLNTPIGVFSLLDEECSLPRSTDATLVAKFEQHFGSHESFKRAPMKRNYPSFTIAHFAGDVEYNAVGFLEKNRDNLAQDIVSTMQDSTCDVLAEIFWGEILPTGQIRPGSRPEAARTRRGKVVAAEEGNKVNRRSPTLSSQFKASLSILIERMTACYPHFVRCIKPNQRQASDNFVDEFVRCQLLYTGVLETTRIRKEGYSWRPTFAEFVKRYAVLAFPVTKLNMVKSNASTAERVAAAAGIKKFLIGKTKIFLKYFHARQMEDALQEFYDKIIRAQAAVRAKFARKRLAVLKERAKMNAAERAAAEAREAEERSRLDAIRREREAVAEARRRAEQEMFEAEQRREQELRLLAEQEVASAEADARRREFEQLRLQEEALAEEARQAKLAAEQDAEIARRLKQEADEVLQKATEEAEQTAAQLEELARLADLARKEREAAEAEALKAKKERVKSMKKRQIDAERAAREAKERAEAEALAAEERRIAKERAEAEARAAEDARMAEERRLQEQKEEAIRERLRQMELEVEEARRRAEAEAAAEAEARRAMEEADRIAKEAERRRIEQQLRDAEEKAQEEADRAAADFRRPDFNLAKRVERLIDAPATIGGDDVTVDEKTCTGYLQKMGLIRKAWKKRFFVFDVQALTLKYYESPKHMKKAKGEIDATQILRVYAPSATEASSKTPFLFMIETLHRVYYCQAPSEESLKVWIGALGAVAEDQQDDSD